MIRNDAIAELFAEVADLLAIDGANPFRVRAYSKAVDRVQQTVEPLAEMDAVALAGLQGIGKDLAAKIRTIVDTGTLPLLDDLREKYGPEIRQLLSVRGLGPKRLGLLHREAGVRSMEELKAALATGRVENLGGFGSTLVARLAEAVERAEAYSARTLWSDAEAVVHALVSHLKAATNGDVDVAGSFRRGRETVGDLDVLVTGADATAVMAAVRAYDRVRTVEASGETKTTVQLTGGLRADVRVVPDESAGAALQYFTGSKAHNVAVRSRALAMGLRVNEYGVWRGKERIAGGDEEGVYAALGLEWVPPELREGRGEVDAAARGTLPHLVTEADIRGDLHLHTRWSDGADHLLTMVRMARVRGDAYVAITDHSPLMAMVNGLNGERLAEQREAIAEAQDAVNGIRVLWGCEVDILKDGRLDLPDDVLADLEIRVCSLHTYLDLGADEQTARVIKAMENPGFQIWGHPTSRLLLHREGVSLHLARVLDAAAANGVAIEINAQPSRLDGSVEIVRGAVDRGIPIVISTDAHSRADLDFRRHGVRQARRAGLTSAQVLNTRDVKGLLDTLR